jgi:GlpG protein
VSQDPNPSAADGTARPSLRWPSAPVTYVLIGASVVVGLASHLGKDLQVVTHLTLADLRGFDGTIPGGLAAIAHGQVWRLVTPILVHFGILHLLFNMLWLKDLGTLIETRWRPRTLLALVLVSAVVANLAQFLVDWDLQRGLRFANALSGGMSGVVYCLLGYVWIRARYDRSAGIAIHQQTVVFMLVWLAACFTGALGTIANSAHATGLLVGMAWGRLAAVGSGRMAGER